MVAADGEPIAPTDVKQKFVKQCGVIVRDFVPITIQEWNKPKDRDVTWLGDESKKRLFQKLMQNFTLPWPEVDPEEVASNPLKTCELHVQVMGISMKVAVGYAVPIGPTPTFHCSPVPPGYAIVGVDEVFKGFEEIKLDHPAGEEGEIVVLGDAKRNTILWRKDSIVFPRPSTPQSSDPAQHSPGLPPSPPSPPKPPSPQPRSPARESPPPQSPARQSPPPQSPARQSPPPQSPPRESPPPQSPVRSGRLGLDKNRLPKRKLSPLPKIPHKNMGKRPYDRTPEENAVYAEAEKDAWFAKMKEKPKKFPDTPEEHAKVVAMLKNLQQPPPAEEPDYERSIRKATKRKAERSVPQLGTQKKQSVSPLKVVSNTEAGSSRVRPVVPIDDKSCTPEIVAMFGEAAAAQGLTIHQYLDRIDYQKVEDYKYKHGRPLVKPELVKDLPTKMRRLHNWYMAASRRGGDWLYIKYNNEAFGWPVWSECWSNGW